MRMFRGEKREITKNIRYPQLSGDRRLQIARGHFSSPANNGLGTRLSNVKNTQYVAYAVSIGALGRNEIYSGLEYVMQSPAVCPLNNLDRYCSALADSLHSSSDKPV